MKYSIDWARSAFAANPEMQFVFFWRHTPTTARPTHTCLSQWYPCSFVVGGTSYQTAERYMMAEKARLFGDAATFEKIMAAPGPRECKALGRTVAGFNSAVWDSRKRDIVLRGSLAKFSQNTEFRAYLLGTGNAVLVEASPYDRIWGVGLAQDDPQICDPRNWRGENLLGFALMDARDTLRKAEAGVTAASEKLGTAYVDVQL